MKIRTRRELEDYVNKGNKVKYLFFWGHTHTGQAVTKACFSQWYGAPFSEDGKEFATAEHYMMYGKAKLFGDELAMENILKSNNPGAAKAEVQKPNASKLLIRCLFIVSSSTLRTTLKFKIRRHSRFWARLVLLKKTLS